MNIKFKIEYRDGSEKTEEFEREVQYIPDRFKYRNKWWKRKECLGDFDTGKEKSVVYTQEIK
ncbi:hypothetical protein ACI3ER_11995 [Bacillus sp. Wb]